MVPYTVLKQTVLKCSFHNNTAVGDAMKDKDTNTKQEPACHIQAVLLDIFCTNTKSNATINKLNK